MSERRSIPFEAQLGAPAVIKVKGKDGKSYEIRLSMAIFEVLELGSLDDKGQPVFEFSAGMATHVRLADEGEGAK